MPSPFPGMDPYLEDSELWKGFHHSIAAEIVAHLNPLVGPKYFADVEVRTVMEDVLIASTQTIYPDAAVLERTPSPAPGGPATATIVIPTAPIQRTLHLEEPIKLRAVQIKTTEAGHLVASIEILSPFNKRPGQGLEAYRRKRSQILRSPVHLIELDLLRDGERPGPKVNEPPLEAEYILLVNRSSGSDQRLSEIWPVALNEPLPLLPVPLLPPDVDVPLDLNAVLRSVYTRAGCDWRIDY